MNDEPNPPPSEKPSATSALSTALDKVSDRIREVKLPPPEQVLGWTRENSRRLQYAGVALIVLAMPLTWWSLTRYRVSEQRGVDMGAPAAHATIEKNMDEDDKKEYYERIAAYTRAWTLNLGRYESYYYDHLGDDYAARLNAEVQYNLGTGTLGVRGWSTWTGWFGIVFVLMFVASLVAPKFMEDLQPIVWSFPLAAAGVFGFFTLLALIFFFTVPGANDYGVAQGAGLGNYLAILGGLLATVGSVFEGIKSMNARLAELAEEGEEEEEDDEDAAAVEEKPKPKPKPRADAPPERKKSRLEDW